jgi:hypothetical protein
LNKEIYDQTEGLTGADTLLRVLSHMGVDRIFSSPLNGRRCGGFAKAKRNEERAALHQLAPERSPSAFVASSYIKSTGKLPR